jgi:hypothetical protein
MGLTPDQFWDLSMSEWQLMIRAFNRRIKRGQAMLAVVQANLMNHMAGCWGVKRRVSVNQLLGGKRFERGTTKQEVTEHFREKGKIT